MAFTNPNSEICRWGLPTALIAVTMITPRWQRSDTRCMLRMHLQKCTYSHAHTASISLLSHLPT
jgi:hypothetical protein